MKRIQTIILLTFPFILFTGGCNPATTAVKFGVHLVGKAVDDEETQKLGQELIGRSSAAAEKKFGSRLDTLRDVNSTREWQIYPTKLDVLGNQRYVVEVAEDRIVAISKTEKGQGTMDLPRKLMLKEKVKGRSPRQCENRLEMGPPLLTARSEKNGLLSQIYDAQMVEGIGGQKYCILRFDRNQRCCEVNLVEVSASTKKGWIY
jgi:hypothetical protein